MAETNHILDTPAAAKIKEVNIKGIKVFITITIINIILFFVNTLRYFTPIHLLESFSKGQYIISSVIFSIMFLSLAFILNAFKENPFTSIVIYIDCIFAVLQSIAFYFISSNYYLLAYFSSPSSVLSIILIVMFFLIKHPFIKGHFRLLAAAMILSQAQQSLFPYFVGVMDVPSQSALYGSLIHITVPIIILMIQLKVSKVKLEYAE